MQDSMTSSPGTAGIVKVGHTASSKHGSNPDAKTPGQTTARDLALGTPRSNG